MGITIKWLYPEVNNLYGERGNILYLQKKLSLLGIENTLQTIPLTGEPDFSCDILFIPPCTENSQKIVLKKLSEYKEAFFAHIRSGQLTLMTGNSIELLGSHIEEPNGERIEGLNLYPFFAKRTERLRINALIGANFGEMKLVGFKNQLSRAYETGPLPHFAETFKGFGMNEQQKGEGIMENGLIATYMLGPILPLNPYFTDWVIERMCPCAQKKYFDFEEKAYEKRLAEFTGA